MKYFVVTALILFSSLTLAASPVIRLQKGLVITQSVIISRETYRLNADTSLEIPLIIIEGKNITVDFNNCTLQGSNDKNLPDEFYGLAVLVKKGSSNIIIKNTNIHGFKIALMADSVEGLQVDNCNLSYNYRQHLHSNWKREDVCDWMSYHHNENDEWMRYGAGIYLKDCSHAIIKNNFITGGQCGLMMMRCDSNEIYNNNFSFNSGIGIGLYRSSYNKIYSNQLDFNVRGYSDGIYNRGQDSAGILVFEQCNNNVFAYNSVTHGGDGFFLWAGQYTMDTGEGGCNDNLIYGNDFSYAPTNGVEVTFSRNDIVNNIIKECDNGIWGGYSFHTKLISNRFEKNKSAIAIEHGSENEIIDNTFISNKTSIKLWSREKQPSGWGYAKYRDTRSRNYFISDNHFNKNLIDFDVMGTDSLRLQYNTILNSTQKYKIGERVSQLDSTDTSTHITDYSFLKKLNDMPGIKKSAAQNKPGKNQIRITGWGPYNFHYPFLWLKNIDSNGLYHFEVLTPKVNSKFKIGNWKLKTKNGFHIIQNLNDQLTAKADSSVEDRFIQLEYTGAAFTDMFGNKHAANNPYIFEYREFDPHFKWDINFYKWDSLNDPQKNYAALMQSLISPVYVTTASAIDYTWWGAIGKDLPADSFATVATSSVQLKEGDYSIGVTADDLVKVFIDNKEVIDAWDASYTTLDENTHHQTIIHLTEGKHQFKIVHADITGLATLMFYINPLNNNR